MSGAPVLPLINEFGRSIESACRLYRGGAGGGGGGSSSAQKWKRRYIVIRQPHDVRGLEVDVYKSETARRKGVHTEYTHMLQDAYGFESGFELDRERWTLAVFCSSPKSDMVMAFASHDDLVLWETWMRSAIHFSEMFFVQLIQCPDESALKQMKTVDFHLHLHDSRFCLVRGCPPRVCAAFPLSSLRQYGFVFNQFHFECGIRGHPEAAGWYKLSCNQLQRLQTCFGHAVKGSLHSYLSRREASPDVAWFTDKGENAGANAALPPQASMTSSGTLVSTFTRASMASRGRNNQMRAGESSTMEQQERKKRDVESRLRFGRNPQEQSPRTHHFSTRSPIANSPFSALSDAQQMPSDFPGKDRRPLLMPKRTGGRIVPVSAKSQSTSSADGRRNDSRFNAQEGGSAKDVGAIASDSSSTRSASSDPLYENRSFIKALPLYYNYDAILYPAAFNEYLPMVATPPQPTANAITTDKAADTGDVVVARASGRFNVCKVAQLDQGELPNASPDADHHDYLPFEPAPVLPSKTRTDGAVPSPASPADAHDVAIPPDSGDSTSPRACPAPTGTAQDALDEQRTVAFLAALVPPLRPRLMPSMRRYTMHDHRRTITTSGEEGFGNRLAEEHPRCHPIPTCAYQDSNPATDPLRPLSADATRDARVLGRHRAEHFYSESNLIHIHGQTGLDRRRLHSDVDRRRAPLPCNDEPDTDDETGECKTPESGTAPATVPRRNSWSLSARRLVMKLAGKIGAATTDAAASLLASSVDSAKCGRDHVDRRATPGVPPLAPPPPPPATTSRANAAAGLEPSYHRHHMQFQRRYHGAAKGDNNAAVMKTVKAEVHYANSSNAALDDLPSTVSSHTPVIAESKLFGGIGRQTKAHLASSHPHQTTSAYGLDSPVSITRRPNRSGPAGADDEDTVAEQHAKGLVKIVAATGHHHPGARINSGGNGKAKAKNVGVYLRKPLSGSYSKYDGDPSLAGKTQQQMAATTHFPITGSDDIGSAVKRKQEMRMMSDRRPSNFGQDFLTNSSSGGSPICAYRAIDDVSVSTTGSERASSVFVRDANGNAAIVGTPSSSSSSNSGIRFNFPGPSVRLPSTSSAAATLAYSTVNFATPPQSAPPIRRRAPTGKQFETDDVHNRHREGTTYVEIDPITTVAVKDASRAREHHRARALGSSNDRFYSSLQTLTAAGSGDSTAKKAAIKKTKKAHVPGGGGWKKQAFRREFSLGSIASDQHGDAN